MTTLQTQRTGIREMRSGKHEGLSPIAELHDVRLQFGDKTVLNGVSLAAHPQERLVIIGQSGMGKTTILRLVLGILAPTQGSVFFKGHEISQMSPQELQQMRTRIGMAYREAALLRSSSVRESLARTLQAATDKRRAEMQTQR